MSLRATYRLFLPHLFILAGVVLGLPSCYNAATTYLDYLQKADSLALKGNFKEAIPLYSRAIAMKPDSANEAYKLRAACFYNLEKYDSALPDISRAIAISPNEEDEYMLKARLDEMTNNLQGAVDAYTNALRINPADTLALNNRGSVYNKLNEPGLALGDFTKAIHLDTSYWAAYNNRALVYQHIDMMENAIGDCNKAISLNPKGYDAYYNRAICYLSERKYQQALIDLNTADSLMPSNALTLNNRGIARYNLGQKEDAKADWTLAAKLGNKDAQQYLDKYFRP